MPRLAANLSTMFTELPFRDRFAAAADQGFSAVEFMFPYELSIEDAVSAAADRHLEVVLFNTPAGDWAAGERGLAALPDRICEFRDGVELAVEYARALSCPRLHVMAGKTPADDPTIRRTLVENVSYAADTAASYGIDILLEPINTRVDIPGYYYSTSEAAIGVIKEVDRANVRLQYDIYHMQIMEGDIARRIEELLPLIGHIQLADNPGRQEPGTGEIAYSWLLKHIDDLGYKGYVGCEYKPAAETVAGLAWARPYLT